VSQHRDRKHLSLLVLARLEHLDEPPEFELKIDDYLYLVTAYYAQSVLSDNQNPWKVPVNTR
jgi:hypothetical protein